jgi:hypothetical protein
MRRMTWFAVITIAVVLGGSGFVPPERLSPLVENAILLFLTLSAAFVLYVNFPTPARDAVRRDLRRGRPLLTVARRRGWSVDAVRSLATIDSESRPSMRSGGRRFRLGGDLRRIRFTVRRRPALETA